MIYIIELIAKDSDSATRHSLIPHQFFNNKENEKWKIIPVESNVEHQGRG